MTTPAQIELDSVKQEIGHRGPFNFVNRSCDSYRVIDYDGNFVATCDNFNLASFIVNSLNSGDES